MRRTVLIAALALVAALLPASVVAASPTGSAAVTAADAFSLDGRDVVELAAPKPDWYTDELHAQVIAAGAEGVPIPDGVDVPASSLAFAGIRPGAWIIAPAGCTTNFVFGSGTHIGTAGHCTAVGDEVTLITAPGLLVNIGTTVKSIDKGIGNDFALIEIRDELRSQVNPSMAHVAGPTGSAAPAFGDAVVHSGHGLVIGTGGTPRAGVVGYTGPGDGGDAFGWSGAAAPGDSGSAVRNATGAAAGNLTHLVVGTDYLPSFIAGSTVAQLESLAGMPVATASLVPDPLP